jgi:methanogenic corrinoid protein MtbC1
VPAKADVQTLPFQAGPEIGADGYAEDAIEAVTAAKSLLGVG